MECHGTSAIAYAQFGQLARSLNEINRESLSLGTWIAAPRSGSSRIVAT